MKRPLDRLIGSRLRLLLVASIALGRCTSVHVYQASIDVTIGKTPQENLEIAKSLVTESEFARLKSAIKLRSPTVTDDELASMGYKWSQSLGTDRGVSLVVSCATPRDRDPKAIVDIALELLKQELERLQRLRGSRAIAP